MIIKDQKQLEDMKLECPWLKPIERNFYKEYYLIESLNAKNIFDDVIYDIIGKVFAEDLNAKLNPSYKDAIDCSQTNRKLFSGWSFDSINQHAVKGKSEKSHPIFIEMDYSDEPLPYNMWVNERTDYTSRNDAIIIRINMKSSNIHRELIGSYLMHEFVHVLQMYRSDNSNIITKQSVAYRDITEKTIMSKGVHRDFVTDNQWKVMFDCALHVMSEEELVAKIEEINEYIRRHSLEIAANLDKQQKREDYVNEFIELYGHTPGCSTPLPGSEHFLNRLFQASQNISEDKEKNEFSFDELKKSGFNLLILYTSVLTELNIVDDPQEAFKNYKQCLLIQKSKFILTNYIEKVCEVAIKFLRHQLEAYIERLFYEVDGAFCEYKVFDMLIVESIVKHRKQYKTHYSNYVLHDYSLPRIPFTTCGDKMLHESYDEKRNNDERVIWQKLASFLIAMQNDIRNIDEYENYKNKRGRLW